MKRWRSLLPVAALIGVGVMVRTSAWATTYPVGRERRFKTVNSVLALLRPGDVVEVDPGVYQETVRLTMNGSATAPIVIRGVKGARPVVDAAGLDTSGRGSIPRGAIQMEGAYLILEHLEVRNARNGENAAGIRLLASTNAVIRDCVVSHNDMGIFGDDRQTALIDRCEVTFNGTEKFNGYSHNFYMHGNRVVVSHCFIHDSLFGQNFKSRAHFNELWFNRITRSNEGEVGFVDAAGSTDRPNSHSLMVGNILVSRPDRTGNTSKFILFGGESGSSHNGTLFMFHNTCVAGSPSVNFITLDDPLARGVFRNNVLAGSAHILNLARPPLSLVASDNDHPSEANLKQLAPAWDEPMTYLDGEGIRHTLRLGALSP